MKTIWGAVLLVMMMLATVALAADLDTPRIGAAVCAPEEENGSVVLHEVPDGRSETLMRYFQGAPAASARPCGRLGACAHGDDGRIAGGLYSAGMVEIRRGGDARGAAIRRDARHLTRTR